ncbi:hypothetical protein AB0J43_54255, partial [Nonomuraea fuscirosea]
VEARRSLLAAVDLAREAGDARTVGEAAMIMEGVSDFVWDDVGAALYAEALAGIPSGTACCGRGCWPSTR